MVMIQHLNISAINLAYSALQQK